MNLKKIKKGDRVEGIDEHFVGKVVAVDGETFTVEDSDGFLLQFEASDLIKVPEEKLSISTQDIASIIKEKEISKRKQTRIKPKERTAPAMEVDLHINKLVPSSKGMSNYDMLSLQLDTAKRQLEFAIRKRIQKVVFVHGVGEGVLKLELHYLFGRYENVKFYDADYKKYGLGATEIYILQNA